MTLTCEVLEVSANGYFKHWRRGNVDKRNRPRVNKRISDKALLVHIKAIHVEVKEEYGWPKMGRNCRLGAFGWARSVGESSLMLLPSSRSIDQIALDAAGVTKATPPMRNVPPELSW